MIQRRDTPAPIPALVLVGRPVTDIVSVAICALFAEERVGRVDFVVAVENPWFVVVGSVIDRDIVGEGVVDEIAVPGELPVVLVNSLSNEDARLLRSAVPGLLLPVNSDIASSDLNSQTHSLECLKIK